jgi:hypothetical protein
MLLCDSFVPAIDELLIVSSIEKGH